MPNVIPHRGLRVLALVALSLALALLLLSDPPRASAQVPGPCTSALAGSPNSIIPNLVGNGDFESNVVDTLTGPGIVPVSRCHWISADHSTGANSTTVSLVAAPGTGHGDTSAEVRSPGGNGSGGFWLQDIPSVPDGTGHIAPATQRYLLNLWVFPQRGEQSVGLLVGYDRCNGSCSATGVTRLVMRTNGTTFSAWGQTADGPNLPYGQWSQVQFEWNACERRANVRYGTNSIDLTNVVMQNPPAALPDATIALGLPSFNNPDASGANPAAADGTVHHFFYDDVRLQVAPCDVMPIVRPADPCDDPDLVPTMTGTPGNDAFIGGPGDDVLFGLAGNDAILGGGGNDIICGGPGDDVLVGGDGDDSVSGGPGNDRITGDAGSDSLFGGDGDDIILGGAGIDRIEGGMGNDNLNGGTEDDWLWGGDGGDVLNGELGNDRLFGEGDGDQLAGLAGDDLLDGGPGTDLLFGGAGVDVLDGGPGSDQLNGGPGNDFCAGGTGGGGDFLTLCP